MPPKISSQAIRNMSAIPLLRAAAIQAALATMSRIATAEISQKIR